MGGREKSRKASMKAVIHTSFQRAGRPPNKGGNLKGEGRRQQRRFNSNIEGRVKKGTLNSIRKLEKGNEGES